MCLFRVFQLVRRPTRIKTCQRHFQRQDARRCMDVDNGSQAVQRDRSMTPGRHADAGEGFVCFRDIRSAKAGNTGCDWWRPNNVDLPMGGRAQKDGLPLTGGRRNEQMDVSHAQQQDHVKHVHRRKSARNAGKRLDYDVVLAERSDACRKRE